ncbi:heavy-metal-associated domain-containing protein [Suttonella ornithocola]|uniref:Copper chaperone CopZ n=1 Tax=Suttonella ornithocola TaxID=279832 RepID=A0A380RB64_9GAMM|nr:heavy-metal-associated domain-containing protein [Suttonella ornithocola]SUQ09742.1 Copper chaperone CopZ [Suttonella ornithocola]
MQKIFTIDGMTCNGCANSVKNALESVPGISEVTVNLAEKQVAVVFDERKFLLKTLSMLLKMLDMMQP